MASTCARLPLHGLLVLEVGARIGVSVAGSLLAQLGAEVVCVEGQGSGGFPQPKWLHRDQLLAGKRMSECSSCPTTFSSIEKR